MDIIKGFIEQTDEHGLQVGGEPLSELMEEYAEKTVSVHFFICDQEKSFEEMRENLILVTVGMVEADYGAVYSEYTGYLWTNDKLIIGTHDVINDISNYEGKYLYMEIEKH